MTRTTVLLCVVLATGCTSMHNASIAAFGGHHHRQPPMQISTFEERCAPQPFASLGTCMRDGMSRDYPSWRSDAHADLVDVYLAWLDAAGQRVAEGRMEESEARLGAAEMKVRLKQIASERATNASLQQQAAVSQMLSGLALMEAAQPRPVYSPQIVCTSNAYGGTVTTTCR